MKRADAIRLLWRVPIGTPLAFTEPGGDEIEGEAEGVVGRFAGLGFRAGADTTTIRLTSGHRVRDGYPTAVATEPLEQVDLDEVHLVTIELRDAGADGRVKVSA